LAEQLGLELRRVGSGTRLTFAAGEEVLSEWMRQNAFVTWLVHPAPWELEKHLIGELALPLNLDQNDRHPLHAVLSQVRRKARARARALPIVGETNVVWAAPGTTKGRATTRKARTDWTRLRQHFREHPVQPGERVRLIRQDLQRILGVTDLPKSINRVTLWDPLMGKRVGGLQNVLNEAHLLPVAFEWEGQNDQRPTLRWIILQKWGTGVMK
jgi:hypothetical protein